MKYPEDYVKRVLKVLVYIEDHLDSEISLEELGKVACLSPFHFHRIFQAIVGETAHQYVRRLRLERAAGRLLYTAQPVTEIALEATYETPSAFTRAFKQCMGQSPRNYRSLNKEVNTMAKKINGLPMIKPEKIEKISALNLIFIRKTGNYVTSSEKAWKAMMTFIKENQLDETKIRYFSISHDDPNVTDEDKLRFDACIQTEDKIKAMGEASQQIIKGGKYAIFSHAGPHSTLSETFSRIFLRWLPESRETYDDFRPIFCEHFELEHADINEDKLFTKIYIPITQ